MNDGLTGLVGAITPAFNAMLGVPQKWARVRAKSRKLQIRLSETDWLLLQTLARSHTTSPSVVLARLWSLYCRALRTGRDPHTGEPLNEARPYVKISRPMQKALEGILTERIGKKKESRKVAATDVADLRQAQRSHWFELLEVPVDGQEEPD